MKTFKNIYSNIYAYENLYESWRKAARGKRKSPEVAGFEYFLTDNLLQLEEELRGPVPVACGLRITRPYIQTAPAFVVNPEPVAGLKLRSGPG